MAWEEKLHPRWPAESPDSKGGEFRSWAHGLVAGMLPSLKDLLTEGSSRKEIIHRFGHPKPEGLDEFHQHQAEISTRARTAAKQVLEGLTDRTGQVRIEDVSATFLHGGDGPNEKGGPRGHLSISGAVRGVDGSDRGYFRVSVYHSDDSGKWTMYVDRFYVHLGEEDHRGFGTDRRLAPGLGGGLATEALGRLADWGRASGIEQMTIGPSDTGFYAWAALGFDFEDFESRKIAAEGLALVTPTDLQRYGLSRAAAVAGAIRLKAAAAQVLAGTMSAHRLSQLGRRKGQGRDDMWLGKAGILFAGWGGGVYSLKGKPAGRL